MLNTGLNPQQVDELYRLLTGAHRVKITVHLLDRYLNFVRDISDLLIDGTVDMDADADVTRSAGLKFADPNDILGLDSINPAQGVNFFGRYIRVFYGIWPLEGLLPSGTAHYTYPIFTGPITDYSKDGVIADVECQGKEVLASKGSMRAVSLPAGWPQIWHIDYCLRKVIGERWLTFALDPWYETEFRMLDPWNVEAGTNLWVKAKELAYTMGCQLFYNAYGVAMVRPSPSLFHPIWTFDDTWLTSPPATDRNWDDLYNAVRVVGGTPQGWAGIWAAEAVAPPNHPLSPENLSLNPPYPFFIPRFIEDDTLTSSSAVTIVAQMALNQSLMLGLSTTFSSAVVPHLEEGDCFTMNSKYYYGQAMFDKCTIPLVGDYTMSVGFLSNVSFLDVSWWRLNRTTITSAASDQPLRQKAAEDRMKRIQEREKARLKAAEKRRKRRQKRREKRRKKNRKNHYGIFEA